VFYRNFGKAVILSAQGHRESQESRLGLTLIFPALESRFSFGLVKCIEAYNVGLLASSRSSRAPQEETQEKWPAAVRNSLQRL